MTLPDFPALLADRSPDAPRAALLDSLRLGCAVSVALAGAVGHPVPLGAVLALRAMREEGGPWWDAEVAEACEESERRSHERASHVAVSIETTRGAGVPTSGMYGETSPGREAVVAVRVAGQDIHERDRSAMSGKDGVSDDGSEQGKEAAPDAGSHDAARDRQGQGEATGSVPLGTVDGAASRGADGAPTTPLPAPHLGVPLEHLHPCGRGRAEAPEAKESGGESPPEVAAAMLAEEWEDSPPIEEDTAPPLYDRLLELDAKRGARGHPPLSLWWRWSFGDFLASLKPWGVYLVGRGGGKSTSLELLAATLARYGVRRVPPGQVWTMPFISVGPDDANRRINGIAACFKADGLAIVGEVDGDGTKVKPGEGVKIARAPRGSLELLDAAGNEIQLASIAGTIGNVSGPSTFGLVIDEAAKLLDKATGANPLTEIIASGAQTSRGRPGWLAIICSSAWEPSGVHYGLITAPPNEVNYVATIGADFIDEALQGFDTVAAWERRRGDSEASRRILAHAASLNADSPLVPSWVANTTIGNPRGPEAWEGAALATRMLVEVLPESALEGVPRILYWLRENGSVPLLRGDGGVPLTLDDIKFMAAQNRAMNEPMGRTLAQRADDYMAGLDEDPRGYRGL